MGKQQAIKVVLKDVLFSFVHVFEQHDNNGKMEYGACLLIDKNNTKAISALEHAQKAAFDEGIACDLWTVAQAPTVNTYYFDGDAELKT